MAYLGKKMPRYSSNGLSRLHLKNHSLIKEIFLDFHIIPPGDSKQAEVDIRAKTLSLTDIPPITTTLDRYLSICSLAFLFDTSTTTISKMVADGALPKPIYLSPKLPRWRLSDLHKHPLIQYKGVENDE